MKKLLFILMMFLTVACAAQQPDNVFYEGQDVYVTFERPRTTVRFDLPLLPAEMFYDVDIRETDGDWHNIWHSRHSSEDTVKFYKETAELNPLREYQFRVRVVLPSQRHVIINDSTVITITRWSSWAESGWYRFNQQRPIQKDTIKVDPKAIEQLLLELKKD